MIWSAGLAILGGLIGSFVVTTLQRWRTGRPIVLDRSRCDHCARTLGPFELIPLISAVALRFRCRTCRRRIDAIHWQFEAAACLIGLSAGLAAPGVVALAGALFGWQLLALAMIDVRHLLLPNALTVSLATTGLVVSAVGLGAAPVDSLLGGLVGFGALWAVKELYRTLRGREGLGGGDPKLFGAIGCWLGWQMLPYTLLGASVLGLALAATAFARGQQSLSEKRFPFGAHLALAAFLTWLAVTASTS
ncbi:MAG: A24 family peptidase [Novosphingobium sp.]